METLLLCGACLAMLANSLLILSRLRRLVERVENAAITIEASKAAATSHASTPDAAAIESARAVAATQRLLWHHGLSAADAMREARRLHGLDR